jgi:X-Pro dipeptidyl-peptidase
MNADDDDATGDRNVFWDARDYRAGLGNVTASVLAVHGLQDDNVRMDHFAGWWAPRGTKKLSRNIGHLSLTPSALVSAMHCDSLPRQTVV